MILNCLVIDDEPLARMHIENYIARVPWLKLCGSARNASIAQNMLNNEAIDLIFLDIKMPQTSGIEFLRQAKLFQQIIMVTAYPEFAIEGFELEVTDYLMKPVTFERFLKAVEKARAKVTGVDSIRAIKHEPGFFYIKTNQRYEKLSCDDILYIESMLNYIHIFTTKGKFTVYSSMKNAEAILPKDQFVRIHKSYIVSIAKINTIEAKQICINNCKLPISRGNRSSIIEAARKLGLILEISPKVGESESPKEKKDHGQ
jgi:DNA-binding LytR/AlgR family response regulator